MIQNYQSCTQYEPYESTIVHDNEAKDVLIAGEGVCKVLKKVKGEVKGQGCEGKKVRRSLFRETLGRIKQKAAEKARRKCKRCLAFSTTHL